MEKCIIAAVADNRAIGRGNALLWHISADMKYFRKTTSGSPVVMGRKTFESIGRPLPGRRNIVVTRSNMDTDGVQAAHSLEEALELAETGEATSALTGGPETYPLPGSGPDKCFIIGGGEIYRQAMALADRLYITEVHCAVEADTFFPEISPEIWEEVSRSERMTDENSGLGFEFVVYRRK